MDINTYEAYNILHERLKFAKRARSLVDILSLLYTGRLGDSASPVVNKLMRSLSMSSAIPDLNVFDKPKKEKEVVSVYELKNFIIEELRLEPHDRVYQSLDKILDVLVIKG